MSMINSFPVVSQLKSLVQVIVGDTEGALQTQEDFAFENTFPVISQIASAGYAIGGDHEKAAELQEKFLVGVSDYADALPVVGHIKGGVHYAMGDNDKGDQSMKSASRSLAVAAGGVGGMIAAGPAGAVAGGIAGGVAIDSITTASEVLIKGHNNIKHQGYVGIVSDIHHAIVNEENPSSDAVLGMILTPISDGAGGLVRGRSTGGATRAKIITLRDGML